MPAIAARQTILVIVAHPDDADVHAGGAVARWADEGCDIQLAVVTSGDKGHDDPAMTPERVAVLRQAEQRRAGAILGVRSIEFLDYQDGEVGSAGPRLVEELTRLIREVHPDIIMSHDPYAGPPRYAQYQLHPDHRAVGAAAIDAVYFRAPGPLWYPDHLNGGLAAHRAAKLWLIMGDHLDHFIDITSTFDRKVQAVRAHFSQWGKHADLEGFLRDRAERFGADHGVALAEGFKRLIPT
jgi:LmbE family N-acetylglucosaminyl deacetylase